MTFPVHSFVFVQHTFVVYWVLSASWHLGSLLSKQNQIFFLKKDINKIILKRDLKVLKQNTVKKGWDNWFPEGPRAPLKR